MIVTSITGIEEAITSMEEKQHGESLPVLRKVNPRLEEMHRRGTV